MNAITPPQYQALERYLEAVAYYARNLHVLDLYQRTPLADLVSWQEDKVAAAQNYMRSEEAKLNAACGGNYRELFPENLISGLLASKLGGH